MIRSWTRGVTLPSLLAFIGVKPGCTSPSSARAAATRASCSRARRPTGVVYGQNTPALLQRFAEKPWSTRLAKPVMKNVVRADSRIPTDPRCRKSRTTSTRSFIGAFLHDTVWLKVDRDRMNKAVFAALKRAACSSSSIIARATAPAPPDTSRFIASKRGRPDRGAKGRFPGSPQRRISEESGRRTGLERLSHRRGRAPRYERSLRARFQEAVIPFSSHIEEAPMSDEILFYTKPHVARPYRPLDARRGG